MTPVDHNVVPLQCRQYLRRLELQAYAAIVSVFRAQGDFNSEKKRILNELQYFLSIPLERHQAEIRRAVADEQLNAIANSITGEETCTEWLAEGRRLIPLMPRPLPLTKASQIATNAAKNYIKNPNCLIDQSKLNDNQKQFVSIDLEHDHQTEKSNLDANQTDNSCKEQIVEPKNKKLKLGKNDDISSLLSNTCANSGTNVPTSPVYLHCQPNVPTIKTTTSTLVSAPKSNTTSSTSSSASSPSPLLLPSNAIGSAPMSEQESIQKATALQTMMVATPVTSSTMDSNVPHLNVVSLSDSKVTNVVQLPSNTVKYATAQIAVPYSSNNARILSTGKSGTIASQVVVISSNSQPKTITIPMQQNVKTLQLPVGSVSSAGTSTILYQTTSNAKIATGNVNVVPSSSVKSLPAGFTIKAFKPGQTQLSGNFIIMPKNATVVRPTSIRTITLSKDASTVASPSASAASPGTSTAASVDVPSENKETSEQT